MIGALLREIDRKIRRNRPYVAKIRYRLMRWRFQSAGRSGSLGHGVTIHGRGDIHLGDRVAIRSDVSFGGNGRVEIGDRTAINEGAIITALERVSIGRDVMFAPRCYILDVDHRIDDSDLPPSRQGYSVAPVTIGDEVWLGANVVVTKGVTIGRGAVIGANSVVTKDIPPFAIAAGSPARLIRMRQTKT